MLCCVVDCSMFISCDCFSLSPEKVRIVEEVRRYTYEPPSEPKAIIAKPSYFVNRHETVRVRRYEYEPPCPSPRPVVGQVSVRSSKLAVAIMRTCRIQGPHRTFVWPPETDGIVVLVPNRAKIARLPTLGEPDKILQHTSAFL